MKMMKANINKDSLKKKIVEININKDKKIEEIKDRTEKVIIPIINRAINKLIGVIKIIIEQNNKMIKRIQTIIVKIKMIIAKKFNLKISNIKKKYIL
jgi:hypothetical protein